MPDIFTKKKRSAIMASISGKDTKPEILVRKFLFARGFRYRMNDARYPGKPDLVLPKYRTVVFVNGCFWHGHYCRKGKSPKSNRMFWYKKIADNKARDMKNFRKLRKNRWKVIVIWECSLRLKNRFERVMDRVVSRILE